VRVSDGNAGSTESAAVVEQFCQANGQVLLPLPTGSRVSAHAVQTVIYKVGVRAVAILRLSAQQLAGARRPGKPQGRSS
jgi:hypothetical protein